MISIAENDETCSAVLEAMYCGAIPLISNTPTYPGRFTDGKHVIYIENERMELACERLKEIILNLPKIRQEMWSINRIEIRQKFDRKNQLIAIQNLYNTAIQNFNYENLNLDYR
jgi:glycosyltransferase involved in cell wall biosynthesis